MKSLKFPVSGALLAALCALTPSLSQAADVTFSGNASYRERIALPGNAGLTVELIDVAKPETPIGETRVQPAGQVPIAFSLVVDSERLPAGQSYALQARIDVDGSVRFASKEPSPVDPTNPAPASIQLVQATGKGAEAAENVSLVGTQWRVVALAGAKSDPNVTSTLAFNPDKLVNGNGGCNTFRGDVTIEGAAMKFGLLASTMMACEEEKSKQEWAFHQALSKTASFKLRDGELTLLDTDGQAVAVLGAQ